MRSIYIIKHTDASTGIPYYLSEYGWSSYEGDADAYADRRCAEKAAEKHRGEIIAGDQCPRCHGWTTSHPALSRKDNKTAICPRCGMDEAMEALKKGEA